MNSIRAIPELGQLVKVRSHQYVVTDIRKSAIPANIMIRGTAQPENLVTLSSVEDDALGEELQVIWELEPEAVIRERMELPQPTAFDEPAKLDAFLDAVRWGAASTADIRTLQSPFRSGIDRDRPLRLFRELLPAEGEPLYPRRFDLLIVDEAHNVAPSGGGKYAVDSLRTATIRAG